RSPRRKPLSAWPLSSRCSGTKKRSTRTTSRPSSGNRVLLLIPLLPLLGFLVNATMGRRLSKGVSGGVATGAMGLSFGLSVAAVLQMLKVTPVDGVRAIDDVVYNWI